MTHMRRMKTMHALLKNRPTISVSTPRRVLRRMATDPKREGDASVPAKTFKPSVVGEVLTKYVEPDTGYQMTLFPLIRKVEKAKDDDLVSSDLEETRKRELRSLAASQLINIDMPERTRRKILGSALLGLVIALDAWLVVEKVGFWGRFAVTPLLFLGLGYVASGQVGLCNIAQSGMWQVDGEGLKKIEDPDLAQRILSKVNRFNASVGLAALTVSLIFSAVPLT